jgi:hypothetical protein
MVDKTTVEHHAAHILADTSNQFQENLNAETEDGKYEILAALLTLEFLKIPTKPLQKRLYRFPVLTASR